MINTLDRIRYLTTLALKKGETVEDMLMSTTEELGELATCLSVEKGRKKKNLTEDSKVEAIDVIICALSVYFAKGGTISEIDEITSKKLDKWESSVNE